MAKSDGKKASYKRPPEATRFKKGRSGNPKGRPKGSPNLKTVLDNIFGEWIEITVQGRQCKVSKLEASFLLLYDRMAKGNINAARLLLTTYLRVNPPETSADLIEEVSQSDQEILDAVLKRLALKKGNLP